MSKTTTFTSLLATLWLSGTVVWAQAGGCAEIAAHEASPAEIAYQQGKFEIADSLYQKALVEKPDDPELNAAMVSTLLREGRVADAATRANRMATQAPPSARALTALAEVQLRKGQPWLAMASLDAAAAADHCYARVHLIRSRIFRIDSMYASERSELQSAFEIDPHDADIHRAWAHILNPANDIVRIQESLATMTDLEPEIREKARTSATRMLALLSENSQTCQSPTITQAITLPLLPAYENVKEISSYKLEAQFPGGRARLVVDTAASGLYISRALADANGFQHADGAPANTVQIGSARIGSLEFHNCMAGVSETPFTGGVDGYIGTDIFAPFLITLNFPEAKLEVAPLPAIADEQKKLLPGDRYAGPEVHDFSPVYHRNQYLLVPVMLNKTERRLFVLDSGIRLTAMKSGVAHSVSNTKLNFTNAVQTVSGSTLHVYRDSFDFAFANLSLDRRGHILEFEPSAVEESAGMEVGGLLGFDILHLLTLHIDYRDGLVQFSSATPGLMQQAVAAPPGTSLTPAAVKPACESYSGQNAERPLSTAIRGAILDRLDSAHLTPGQTIQLKVAADWITRSCSLFAGAHVYGHVVAAKASKGDSELAVNFDQADCSHHPKQPVSLRVVGLRDATQFTAVHNATPTEVAGGAKSISDAAAAMGHSPDDDMNAGAATYHPGMVDGILHLKLTPEGGPQCSALMTSADRSVRLGTGSEFVITMQSTPE